MAGIPHQSRLAAFEQEIADLRRRRPPTPYRQVLRLLRQKQGVQISLPVQLKDTASLNVNQTGDDWCVELHARFTVVDL